MTNKRVLPVLDIFMFFPRNTMKCIIAKYNGKFQKSTNVIRFIHPSFIICVFQISWMKRDEKNNLKLLTYGLLTYSSDARQSLHFESPNDWQLRLKVVQRSDAGSYQCQMSTHPPRILHYTLNVVGK